MNHIARPHVALSALVVLPALLVCGPAVRAQVQPGGSLADKQGGEISLSAIRNAPGQNKMVWMSAPKTVNPPVIDGTLNLEPGEWSDAPAIAGMLMPTSSQILPLKALTFLTWDEENFYLGMRTEVMPGSVLRRGGRDMDGAVDKDDVIELVFNPLGRDQPEEALFQLMFNALGFRWDAMVTVGVTAKYWDADTWEYKSDYKPGMPHWDLEIKIPIKSMRIKSPNKSGQCWLVLATRDWKYMIDEKGDVQWNTYSSITGSGGFISQENQFPFVLDDSAPVVQLLDLGALWKGQFGFKARFTNTTGKPQAFTALANVYDNTGYKGRDQDWSQREKPLATQSREFSLKSGETAEWAIPATTLPALADNPDKRVASLYGFVFKVSRAGSELPLFVRQCDFAKLEYSGRPGQSGYRMDVAYNPVRSTIMPSCDILDYPDKTKIKGLQVEVFPAGEKAEGQPLIEKLVTRINQYILSDLLPMPALTPGSYPARLTLLATDGRVITSNAFKIVKLDEPAIFPWWDSKAGISDKPASPHQPMRVQGKAVVTTTGQATFNGSAMPEQMTMTGKDLLAAPIRLTASADGKSVAFETAASPKFGKKSAVQVDLSGALRSDLLNVKVANRMEYDGAQWLTLDIQPTAAELKLDYLRLEIPFKPERGQFLFTMAMAGRESWVAEDLTKGEGKIWDSSRCRGLGLTVGNFMPQYVVSDSLRGLCWYANNDQGWVPTDDSPAAEVVRRDGETILRFNLIGKPFIVKGLRQIQFGLLGMPARPLPQGARLQHRGTTQFGNYVSDKVVGYSYPMPADFTKAKDFIEKGTLYDAKTYEAIPGSRAKEWGGEFAPWHDSHTPWKTPDLDPRTYDYLSREFDGYGFMPKLINLRSWQWERYVKAAPISGLYYDTPEGMGFARSIQNGVAYRIPDDQPHGGEIQGGYNITGFREQIKRIYTICLQNGLDNPWIEMHATHGCVVPTSGFLTRRLDGEDFRRPSYRNFMAAWPIRHLRAIDVPMLYGSTTAWLGGYPWDNQVRNVDPLRCQMAALFVHDIWSPGFGAWSSATISGKGVLLAKCDRPPPYGFKNPGIPSWLVSLGMNHAETEFLPYWDNADTLTLTGADGKPIPEVLASAWRILSQNRLIVAVANWNPATIPCRVKVDRDKLGQPGDKDCDIVITDIETDQVLARGKSTDVIAFDVLPLDFRLFMVTAVNPAGPFLVRSTGGPDYVLKHPGLPESLSAVTNQALAVKMLALGINSADAKPVLAVDKTVSVIGADSNALPGVSVAAWRIPSQKRLIVAVNAGDRSVSGKLKVDLVKLGLMPVNNGESIIYSNLESNQVLLRTTGASRGTLLGLFSRARDAEGRKFNLPADQTAIEVSSGSLRFYMVATQ